MPSAYWNRLDRRISCATKTLLSNGSWWRQSTIAKGDQVKLDLKPFVEALKKKDVKKARESLEDMENKLNLKDEFWCGYHLALCGMISAIESGDELSLILKMLGRTIPGESLQKLTQQIQERVSQLFRPEDEIGFSTAWVDALQLFQKN